LPRRQARSSATSHVRTQRRNESRQDKFQRNQRHWKSIQAARALIERGERLRLPTGFKTLLDKEGWRH
jgi:hypothetical protein